MGTERSADELVASARAIAFASRRLERALGDMSLPQFRVLALVASSSERAGRIAERAAVSRPSLSGLLDGLEARGWVRRVTVAGDRRGVLPELTAAGARALGDAEAAMAGAVAELLATASGAQRNRALLGLDALGAVIAARQEAHLGPAAAATSTAPTPAAPAPASPTTPAGGAR